MTENFQKFTILLGSKSPRRSELLKQLKINFKKVTIDSDENYPEGMKANIIAAYLAEKKSGAYNGDINEKEILLCADTIVVCDGEVLGKPENENEAIQILRRLSGKDHEVITGVCLRNNQKKKVFTDHSLVSFNKLSDEDIQFYIENYRPFDKAGSYGIQDWIGLAHIHKIEGSYFNIVGLPTHKVLEQLNKW